MLKPLHLVDKQIKNTICSVFPVGLMFMKLKICGFPVDLFQLKTSGVKGCNIRWELNGFKPLISEDNAFDNKSLSNIKCVKHNLERIKFFHMLYASLYATCCRVSGRCRFQL